MRVKCLAQQHNTKIPVRLGRGPLDPESNALTIRPLRLSQKRGLNRAFMAHSVSLLHPKTVILGRQWKGACR